MTVTKSALLASINSFLDKPKASNGGWAPVDPSEVAALTEILQGLISLKYEKDPDGDLPVAFHLTDKTRYERPLALSIKHPNSELHAQSPEQLYLEGAETASSMAEHYAQKATQYSRAALGLLRDAVTEQRTSTLFGAELKVPVPEGVTPETVRAAILKSVRVALKRMPCPVDFDERQFWMKKCAADATTLALVNVKPTLATPVHNGVKLVFEVPVLDLRMSIGPEDVAVKR